MKIADLHVHPHRVALRRPWGSDVRTLDVIAVTVEFEGGATGHGMSWTPTIGVAAVTALLRHDIRDFVLGRDADDSLWNATWRHLHEAGGGGLTTIALAGLDLAIWDARGRKAGIGVADLLGRHRDEVSVYGSGVNLHYSLDDLVAQAERWVAAGHTAVKIKVGKTDLAEDLDRVAAVRAVLGPDRDLMIDANQRWDLETAERAVNALSRFAPAWIEEPLLSDDTAGYAELRRRIDVPVALGENVHHVHRFRDLLDRGAADIVQPNIVRVGGITPFLEIAGLARERGARLAPHLLLELSTQIAMALPQEVAIEEVEDAGLFELGALRAPSPVRIHRGRATVVPAPGLGLDFAPAIDGAPADDTQE